MIVKVKLFASLRERIGVDETELRMHAGATAAEGWLAVTDAPMPDNVLVAVNLEYVDPSHRLNDGDELAFFPPVTGG